MLKYLHSLTFKSLIYSLLLLVIRVLTFFVGLKLYLLDLVVFIEWELFYRVSLTLVYTILIDWVSLRFISTVIFISSIVLIYSHSYIEGDKSFDRFIILVFIFVLSMIFIVISPNLVRILLGWDGLGLVSYALVIFYQNIKSARAGMITVLSNRVGDVAILVCIAWLFNFGSWDFFYLQNAFLGRDLMLVLMLVVLAGITKSAQIPFSAWLPAAIAAPTPVSALVHSSTLVTAGVYLLIRFHNLLGVSRVLLLVSVMTLLMSGWGANFEYDLKKIIALSTLSQLGIIIMVLSIGLFELAYFHLISHALFKSLLFLCAGYFIHARVNCQDIRLVGRAYVSFPRTNFYFVGCSLSLCGFPFLAGFYSKDLILESYFFTGINLLIYFFMLIGTIFTISYSVRLYYYLYIKAFKRVVVRVSEDTRVSGLLIRGPITILFIFSVLVGSWFTWRFLPPASLILPWLVKRIILLGILVLILGVSAVRKMDSGVKLINRSGLVYWVLGQMWFLPYITSLNSVKRLLVGKWFYRYADNGWLEFIGGQGGVTEVIFTSRLTDKWNALSIKLSFYLLLTILLGVFLVY